MKVTNKTLQIVLALGLLACLIRDAPFAQQGMGPGPGVKGYSSADFVSDSFTEASTIDLVTHVGELGATWTHHPHTNYSGILMKVDGSVDRLYGEGTSAYYASGTPPSADYRVCADFYHVSTIAVNIAIAGRMDTTNDTMYLVRLTDGTTWTLRKDVNATFTTMGTSTNQIPTAGNFKTGCLIMTGDQISFTVQGTTEIGPFTDTAIAAAGKAGVRSTGASSGTTGMNIDNFSAR
jgi:hypothetical protein